MVKQFSDALDKWSITDLKRVYSESNAIIKSSISELSCNGTAYVSKNGTLEKCSHLVSYHKRKDPQQNPEQRGSLNGATDPKFYVIQANEIDTNKYDIGSEKINPVQMHVIIPKEWGDVRTDNRSSYLMLRCPEEDLVTVYQVTLHRGDTCHSLNMQNFPRYLLADCIAKRGDKIIFDGLFSSEWVTITKKPKFFSAPDLLLDLDPNKLWERAQSIYEALIGSGMKVPWHLERVLRTLKNEYRTSDELMRRCLRYPGWIRRLMHSVAQAPFFKGV